LEIPADCHHCCPLSSSVVSLVKGKDIGRGGVGRPRRSPKQGARKCPKMPAICVLDGGPSRTTFPRWRIRMGPVFGVTKDGSGTINSDRQPRGQDMLDSSLEPRQTVSKAARALLAMDAEMRRVATPGFIRLVERCVSLQDGPTMPLSGSRELPEAPSLDQGARE
jgi:hypothetical protein